jgi:flagellar hook assembly protein FlgD
VTITPTPVVGPLIKIHALYPNPFVEKLKIFFVLKFDSMVEATMFNVAGEVVYSSQLGMMPSGDNVFEWGGVNDAGARVASGVYPMRLEALAVNGEQDHFWAFAVVSR